MGAHRATGKVLHDLRPPGSECLDLVQDDLVLARIPSSHLLMNPARHRHGVGDSTPFKLKRQALTVDGRGAPPDRQKA